MAGRPPNTFHRGWFLEDQYDKQIREFGISSGTGQSLGRRGDIATAPVTLLGLVIC